MDNVISRHEPVVTNRWQKTAVGCYVTFDEIVNEPKYMDALQEKIGVNLLVASAPVKYTPEILALDPLKGNGYIGLPNTDDDSLLRKGIEEAHRRGMDIWLFYHGMHGAEKHRELCAVDFNNVPFCDLPNIPYAYCQVLQTYCPSRPEIREWNRASYTYGATNYDVDAIYVSHFRYANPAFFTNIFGCACPFCQEEAAKKGYNFSAMKKACLKLINRLQKMNLKQVKEAVRLNFTLMDYISFLDDGQDVLDWLYFRASVFGDHLKLIRNSIHAATGNRILFVTDTHPPEMAIYAGHNFDDLQHGASDVLMPLSHLNSQTMSCFSTLSWLLCQWVPGLDEPTAIQLVYNFFGYGHIGLPTKSIDSLGILPDWYNPDVGYKSAENFYNVAAPEQIYTMFDLELTQLKVLNTTGMPAMTQMDGGHWYREIIERLMTRSRELGHQGYVVQLTTQFIDKEKL